MIYFLYRVTEKLAILPFPELSEVQPWLIRGNEMVQHGTGCHIQGSKGTSCTTVLNWDIEESPR